MQEGRVFGWLNYARMQMKEIAEGGDGKKIASDWLRDFAIDVEVARKEDEQIPRSEFYEGMVSINEAVLRANPETPRLAESGVLYDPNPAKEHWSTALDVIRDGRGDVEDLATWYAAELRLRGEKATVGLRGVVGKWLTCVVIREDGSEEDVTKLVETTRSKIGRMLIADRKRREAAPTSIEINYLDGHEFTAGQGNLILIRAHEHDPAHVRYEIHQIKGSPKSTGVCSADALSSTLKRWLVPEENTTIE